MVDGFHVARPIFCPKTEYGIILHHTPKVRLAETRVVCRASKGKPYGQWRGWQAGSDKRR